MSATCGNVPALTSAGLVHKLLQVDGHAQERRGEHADALRPGGGGRRGGRGSRHGRATGQDRQGRVRVTCVRCIYSAEEGVAGSRSSTVAARPLYARAGAESGCASTIGLPSSHDTRVASVSGMSAAVCEHRRGAGRAPMTSMPMLAAAVRHPSCPNTCDTCCAAWVAEMKYRSAHGSWGTRTATCSAPVRGSVGVSAQHSARGDAPARRPAGTWSRPCRGQAAHGGHARTAWHREAQCPAGSTQ